MNKFKEFYLEVSPKIRDSLISFNKEILDEDNKIIRDNLEVFSEINKSGKLIRGSLINLGYYLSKNDYYKSLPLALAYEVFETSILVHDDIIDNDYLRRGKITINGFNRNKYNNEIGNNIAICMGDYGLYKANQIIIDNYHDYELGKILKCYNDIVIDTIRGETIDVMLPYLEKNDLNTENLEKSIMDIYYLKTARYTLIGPLKLGMILAGNNDNEIRDIEEIASNMGIAFQIQDDIIGIFGDEDTIGKTVGSDIKEFKQTILYLYIKDTPYYQEFLNYYGKDNYDIDKVRKLLIDSKALEKAKNKLDMLYNDSINKLENITWLSQDKKEIIKDLIIFLIERKK